MKTYLYLLIILSLWVATGCASTSEKLGASVASLKIYTFSELDSLMLKEPRPVAVFLHAEWCKFCKNMEQTTFQNEAVVRLLNEGYYFVSFDGEQRAEVVFQGRIFRYQPTGRNTGTHELAAALGTSDDSLIYPAFLILNTDYEVIFQHNAFLNSEQLNGVLKEGVKK